MRHNDLALMAVFLLALACRTEAQTPSVQPVHDMLVRVLGASTKQQVNFDLRLDPSMRQGFKLFSPSTAANVTAVSVVASGLPELAFGAGYYLRTSAAMSFSWMRTGGNNVQPPSSGFAPVPVLVERYKKVKWSYYQNVCTGSYSMWWWDWDRWEKEIDWMALWGVNLVLAYTGQEQLYKQVYNDLGVNDTILERTFDGPAFLTWSRGQGSFGFGGPLPASFMESQVALNVKIMTRLKLLGMHGILPGFQGNVPKELPAIFPGANSSGGWLDGLDPLFHTVARALAAQVVTEFGGSDFIEADGWFSLETGPWLSTLSSSSSDHRAPNSSRDSVPCEFGGVPFVVPSESEAYVRGRSVFADLTSGSPNATWVYQGYPWFRVWDVCPQSRVALRGFVKGFTDAIPNNKLLVLDLVADGGGDRAIWRYPVDPDTGVKFTRNASIIWCALNNWGGAVHLGGDLSFVMTETSDFFAGMGDQAAGVGLTPEGIDNSPAYFSMVLDSPWTTQPTASDWLQEWGEGRCGNPGVAAAQQAYQLLFETVYRPGQQYLWCCSKPVFCPTALPGDDGVARPDYNTTKLRQALELMVQAWPDCTTPTFHYDLVDVAREWLSMAPCLHRFDQVPTSGPSNASSLNATVAALLELTSDVDTVLQTEPGFLLGSWLQNSRRVADWDGSAGRLADFYEWNSRVQISTWAGAYSRREWSGMVTGYYGERTKIWHRHALANTSAVQELAEFDVRWQNTTWDEQRLPASPVGSAVEVVEKLLQKYKL